MTAIILYSIVLCVVSYYGVRHKKNIVSFRESFFVNNRQSGTVAVAFSIVASCVGGSATLGMAGLAWHVGLPAFWWLGSGAIGLCFLTFFLAKKVRQSGASTLPHMVSTFIGAPARPLSSVIIILAWFAITAAQFSAMTALLAPVLTASWGLDAHLAQTVALCFGAGLVIIYACIGGQAAVIKSDMVQYVVLVLALAVAFVFLYQASPTPFQGVTFEAVNADFPISKLTYFLIILGGSYVVCPMLFGRLLSSKSETTARRGALLAVFGLVLTACLIVALGLLCRGFVEYSTDVSAPSVLMDVLFAQLPPWAGTLVLLGIFSALISSADSSLVTAATIGAHDIFQSSNPTVCRLCVVGMGLGSVLLALSGKGILALLLMANDIYVCGVVVPVFVGMVLYNKVPLHTGMMTLAMAVGGGMGLVSALTENTAYAYGGLMAALLLSLLAAVPLWGKERYALHNES